MKIITVTSINSKVFDTKVNELLEEGWEFHGTPTISTVSEQFQQWDGGDLTSQTITTFSQVMKISQSPSYAEAFDRANQSIKI